MPCKTQAVGVQHCFYDKVHIHWHGAHGLYSCQVWCPSGSLSCQSASLWDCIVCVTKLLRQSISLHTLPASLHLSVICVSFDRSFSLCLTNALANGATKGYVTLSCDKLAVHHVPAFSTIHHVPAFSTIHHVPAFSTILCDHMSADYCLTQSAQMNVWPVHQVPGFTMVQL